MSEFWMSYDLIAQRYGPGYQGYPLFGAVHWAELAATAALLLVVTRWYRRSGACARRRILWGVTALLLADEAALVLAMALTGQWEPSDLPLHLCSIHIFLCLYNTLFDRDWCKEELYALCIPGAAIALLCPGWLGTKAWSFINLHSVSLHALLLLYPILLVAGGFRPQVRRLPAVLAALAVPVVPVVPVAPEDLLRRWVPDGALCGSGSPTRSSRRICRSLPRRIRTTPLCHTESSRKMPIYNRHSKRERR